jgi:prepilin-type N-terminal cleavage/methylation domain-containing protein
MPKTSPDRGFTLIEVMVTIVLLSIMMTIAVTSFWGWTRANDQSGTARTLQSALRQAQQRAITEGRSICVEFGTPADTYSVYGPSAPTLTACDDPNKVRLRGPVAMAGTSVHLGPAAFSSPAGATPVPRVSFTPHGSAWAGTVKVTRNGSSKTYTLTVEGLTGRASLA